MNFDGKLTPEMRNKLEIEIAKGLLKFSEYIYMILLGINQHGLYIHPIPLQEEAFDWLKKFQAVTIAINLATPFTWIRRGICWYLEKGAIMFYDTVCSDPLESENETIIEEFYQYNPDEKEFEFSGIYENGKRIEKGYPDYFESSADAWEFEESAEAYYL